MNWFTLLKSNSGKIAKVPLMISATSLIGMGAALAGYEGDVAKYEAPDRSMVELRGVRDNSAASRLERAANGELTSMPEYFRGNGGSGGVRFAGSESYNGRPEVDGLQAGLAARFSRADGLSTGADGGEMNRIKAAERMSGDYARGGVQNRAASYGVDFEDNNGGGRSGRGGSSGSFASSSMARASGTGVSGTYGGSRSSIGGATGGASSGVAGGSNYEFSSSMPASSSAMALASANKTSRASFGGQRDVTQRRGSNLRKNGGSLKDMADMSASIARQGTKAGANAGAKPFLGGNNVGGGVTFSDAPVGGSRGGSSDFNSVSTAQLQQGTQQVVDDAQQKLEEEKKARKRLLIEILAFLATAAGLALWMYHCFFKMKKELEMAHWKDVDAASLEAEAAAMGTSPAAANLLARAADLRAQAVGHRAAAKVLKTRGTLLLATGSALAAALLGLSIGFASKYNWGYVPIVGALASAGVVGGLIYLKARAVTDAVATDTSKILSKQLWNWGKKQAISGVKGQLVGQASKIGSQLFKG